MNRHTRRGFTLVELMVVIGILGLLVGILAVAVIPKLTEAQSKLEIKQIGDLMQGFQNVATDKGKSRKLNKLDKVKGEEFYEAALKSKIFDAELVSKLVSLNSSDIKAEKDWIFEEDGEMPANSVSYTAPQGDKVLAMMQRIGPRKKIFLTFNSRNWFNYPDAGVIVRWTDGETAEYMTEDVAKDEHGIDGDAWTTSPDDIIGEKKPFDMTFN